MINAKQIFNSFRDVALTGVPSTESDNNLSKIGAGIVLTVLANYRGGVAIRLWDGSLAMGTFDAACSVIFREPGALRELILHRKLLRLAESYLTGAIEVEGDLESLFGLKTYLINLDLPLGTRAHLLYLALCLPKPSHSGYTKNWRLMRAASVCIRFWLVTGISCNPYRCAVTIFTNTVALIGINKTRESI